MIPSPHLREHIPLTLRVLDALHQENEVMG